MAAKTEYGELPFAPTEEDLASLTEAERAYLLRRFVLGNKSLHVECVQPNWPCVANALRKTMKNDPHHQKEGSGAREKPRSRRP